MRKIYSKSKSIFFLLTDNPIYIKLFSWLKIKCKLIHAFLTYIKKIYVNLIIKEIDTII